MESHHMEVHALGIHEMAADRARHRTGGVGDGLFQQWFRPEISLPAATLPGLPGFRSFASLRAQPAFMIQGSLRKFNLELSLPPIQPGRSK